MTKTKKFRSQKGAERTSLVFAYIGLILLSLIWIIPVLWIVLCAFRSQKDIDGNIIGIVPSSYFYDPRYIGFDNFKNIWTATIGGVENAFAWWMLNTLIVAVVDCIISTLLILSVAYCISKLKFKMRKPFMNLSMIVGLFPGFMSMIAIYYLLKSIGLAGNNEASTQWLNLVGLVLAYSAGSGMGFQIAKGFFDVIPNSLVESAKLDGCTNGQIFWKIILPLSKPIIIYTALTSFTGPWMDFIFAQTIIGTQNVRTYTVSVGLYNMMFGQYIDANNFTMFAAGCVCVGIPIVALFMFLQRYYVEGVTAGAVKG